MFATAFDDMPDDLGALAGPAAVHEPGKGSKFDKPAKPEALHIEDCPKCAGSGNFTGYNGAIKGVCFHCEGAGKLAFKTSAAQRAKARASAKARVEKKQQAVREAFAAAHPAAWAWMQANAEGFEFAASMVATLDKFGRLTDKQLAAVEKCAAKAAERAAAKAAEAAAAPAPEALGDSVLAIFALFAKARASGLLWPKVRLQAEGGQGVVLSLAGEKSKHAGQVQVTDGGPFGQSTYFGRIDAAGALHAGKGMTPAVRAVLAKLAADPAREAAAYGTLSGCCCFCGRGLDTGESVAVGYGPTCAEKYGMPWGEVKAKAKVTLGGGK